MAKKKTIKKTPVILRNALAVYERSITRFSDVVCQFTVQNGNQISYDILEVSANPDPTPRVERSITRFKEVVCEFVVIDGTDVHAYELEPVYADITGGGTTYTITNNLTNVTNSNAAASVGDGDPYNATLTADAGYTLDSVTVTMGGVDVTSSVYNAGSINIAAVSGNIVITASASAAENFDRIGNPSIVGGILTPTENNFIKTPQAFNPGSDPWTIIVKYRYSTAVNNAGVIGTIDSNNLSSYGVLLSMRTNKSPSAFLSNNGTSWDISNNLGQTYALATVTDTWYWQKTEFDGSKYAVYTSEDGETYTMRGGALSSASPIHAGDKIGIGLKHTNVMIGDIDLNETKIYINGVLWWEAYN